MVIPIDRRSPVPLYEQIVQHIRHLIETDALPAGAKLPATRELAAGLRVNRNTVNTAYEELLAHGLVTAHVGQGTFVAPRRSANGASGSLPAAPSRPAAPRVDWVSLFSKGSSFAEDAFPSVPRPAAGRRPAISFAAGGGNSALFPLDQLRRSVDRVLREHGETLLSYGTVDGFPPLKTFLRGYLLERGIEAHEDDLLIANGSQQGIDLAARAFLDPGDVVVMEAPSYPGAISVFRALRANIITIPPLAAGLQPGYLENLIQRQRPKMMYVVPTFHNPTGLTAGLETRKTFLRAIAGYNVVVVEDDTHERLRYDGPAVPSLKAISRSRQVVYISTFSTVFPGLRLGWVVADRPVIERLAAVKRITDMHTSGLIQAAVYDFCQRRWLERAIRQVNTERQRRRDAMLAALDAHMPEGVTWTRPDGGLWLTVTLPDQLDSLSLLDDAAAAGVLYTPGPCFHANGGGQSELRLIFSQLPLPSIDEGLRRLGRVIKGALQQDTPQKPRQKASIDPMM
ncbi:MAG: PLP-dependent aminotransferase family protein [Candidatus Latescibacteria bacterium]|nr:PLP-dependent aminotransferase family protein [Candidatus Latescibacterota bacterium]